MKIFQIITVSEFGGAQTIVADLAEGLSSDHEVYILYGGEGEAWKHLSDKINLIRLCKHRKEASVKDVYLALKLLYYRIKFRPDIVHLHSSKMGAMGRVIFGSKTTVYTIHGFDSIRKAFRKFLFVEKLLKNKVAKIVGVSQYDVDCLAEEGINKKVELVYNGVNDHSEVTYPISSEQEITEKLKLLQNDYSKIIMCISRISKQKKFDLFLEIAKNKPEYAFVWIGNKDEVTDLPPNVYCLGEAHFAFRFLKFADIFILPSNYEGLPMSLLEALSFGKPVVASNVGGIPEVLDGQNGFAVENTTDAFIEKIEFILSSENYESFSKAARQKYLSKFTINKMIEGYVSVFKSVVNN